MGYARIDIVFMELIVNLSKDMKKTIIIVTEEDLKGGGKQLQVEEVGDKPTVSMAQMVINSLLDKVKIRRIHLD